MNYDPISGPCAACGLDDVCCDHRGRALCQDCWHRARSAETPYAVFRDADNYCCSNGAYLKEEAEERAAKRTAEDAERLASFVRYRDDPTNSESTRAHYAARVDHALSIDPGWRTYSARPCGRWWGERTAHPGYMARRRAALGAS